MVAFIFGILFVIAGAIGRIICKTYKGWDEDYPARKYAWVCLVAGLVIGTGLELLEGKHKYTGRFKDRYTFKLI